jgi:hypothetical protein
MQIPTNFSAAQAVSIASVVSSRDKNSSQAASAADSVAVQAQLEKSESSNPDRDAQGQGDGLGQHARQRHDENEVALPLEAPSIPAVSPQSQEPPTELDLLC